MPPPPPTAPVKCASVPTHTLMSTYASLKSMRTSASVQSCVGRFWRNMMISCGGVKEAGKVRTKTERKARRSETCLEVHLPQLGAPLHEEG